MKKWLEEQIEMKRLELERLQAQLMEDLDKLSEREEAYQGPWPKKLDVYVHNGKWDEYVMEWAEEAGLKEGRDDDALRNLAYIAYEVKLTYLVEKSGKYTLIACNDIKLEQPLSYGHT